MTSSHLKELRTPASGPNKVEVNSKEFQKMSQGPDQLCIIKGVSESMACILLIEEIGLEKEETMPWSQIKAP